MVYSFVSNAGKPMFCGLKRFFAFKHNCNNCMDEINSMNLNENTERIWEYVRVYDHQLVSGDLINTKFIQYLHVTQWLRDWWKEWSPLCCISI
jgi:hypothetical protein